MENISNTYSSFPVPKDAWDLLSLPEKSEMMKVAIKNGITNLQDIRDSYNEFSRGGYVPSKAIKDRISFYEGKAMTGAKDPITGKWGKNNSFENEAAKFYSVLPESIREQVLSNQDLADNLYSYSYNVGAGNFRKRVVPALERYYSGEGSIRDVENSMWASNDSKLRGLQRRRAEEKEGVRNALLGNMGAVPSTNQESFEFVPSNPQAFSNPYLYQQTDIISEPPVYKEEEVSPYSKEELEKQDRRQRLNALSMVLGMSNPYPTENNSMLNAIGLLTGSSYAKGGSIHIKPENRGKFTRLKERTGHSASWFKAHGTPAQKKMATFELNARKWKHGYGGNLYGDGGGSFWNTAKQYAKDIKEQVLTPIIEEPQKFISRAIMGYVQQSFPGLANPFKDSRIWDSMVSDHGTPQDTYLMSRRLQDKIFKEKGYIPGKEGDYGLVKKAVGNRKLPIYQTAPDAISRDKLIFLGNDGYYWADHGLENPGSYPHASYTDGHGNFYQKAWDLNDYGGKGGATAGVLGNIVDFIGNPVVTTTGFQKMDMNDPWAIEALAPDMAKKGLVPTKINGKIEWTLPGVTVYSKKKKKSYGGNIFDGGDTVGEWVNTIYQNNPKEDYLGEPTHRYDFTQSEEWANAHGYYPDERGHRDDRVKKPAHPSHPNRGKWDKDKFILSELGMQNPNYTLFGLNDGGQDSQASLIYKGGNVIPETTVTPNGNYIFNPYDNIKIRFAYGGNLYDGTTQPTQQMNNGKVLVTNSYGDNYYIDPRQVNSTEWNLTTPEVSVTANPDDVARGRAERWFRDFGTESNDATSVAGGRRQNSHLDEWGIEGAAKAAAWAKDHPVLNNVGLGLSTIPLAVAATPAVVGGGELAATALANPYVDAALTSMGGAHAAQSLANGEANWMTALELAPLGRLAKPLYEGVVQPGMRLFNSPLTGNWTKIGNREYRLSPNSLGVNGSPIESRGIVSQITAENAASTTPEQWTAAQDAAIARGDMEEAQRLRDLHFETIGSPVRTQEGSMRLTHATKNKFNSFDLSKAGTGSGNTTNTEGVIHLSPYDDAALDVFKPKTIKERNAYNLMHLYANNPNPVEVPLETFIKSWNDKEAFKVLRDAGDGIIARGKSPYKLYAERLAEYERKRDAGKLMPWTRKPESPKDFMEEAVVDGYTINNPKNLKLADAITYDDKGIRIPLGMRDNFKINDIRYGLLPFLGLGAAGTLYGKQE